MAQHAATHSQVTEGFFDDYGPSQAAESILLARPRPSAPGQRSTSPIMLSGNRAVEEARLLREQMGRSSIAIDFDRRQRQLAAAQPLAPAVNLAPPAANPAADPATNPLGGRRCSVARPARMERVADEPPQPKARAGASMISMVAKAAHLQALERGELPGRVANIDESGEGFASDDAAQHDSGAEDLSVDTASMRQKGSAAYSPFKAWNDGTIDSLRERAMQVGVRLPEEPSSPEASADGGGVKDATDFTDVDSSSEPTPAIINVKFVARRKAYQQDRKPKPSNLKLKMGKAMSKIAAQRHAQARCELIVADAPRRRPWMDGLGVGGAAG